MKKLLLIIFPVLIFACTKAPENISINKKYDLVENKIQDEINGVCGNEILEAEEECDFSGIISCSSNKNSDIGPLMCIDCKLSIENCVDSNTCDDVVCNGNGTCYEDELDFHAGCKCPPHFTPDFCEECVENFHFDIDGSCISNNSCTEVGCESDNAKCKVSERQARCECIEPWIGDKCDQCSSAYYLKDGKCNGRYCTNSDIECTKFEQCDDYTHVPECVCKTSLQKPDDCTQCIEDLDWVYNELNEPSCDDNQVVSCTSNPDKPENSEDIQKGVLITYTDENGWSSARTCSWQCVANTYRLDDKCVERQKYIVDSKLFPIGVNNEGIVVAGHVNESKITFLDENGIVKTIYTGFRLTEGRIAQDENIYFRTSSTYGIFDPESEEKIRFSFPETTNAVTTLSSNGDVYFGNTIFSFPETTKIEGNYSTASSVSITNQEGQIFTIFENGLVVSSEKDGGILWKKTFTNHTFSSYPAIDSYGFLYLPYSLTDDREFGVLVLNSVNGEEQKKLAEITYLNTSVKPPSISIGNYGYKYIVSDGILRVFNKGNELVHDTMLPYLDFTTGYTDIPPVITDEKTVFFTNYYSVRCYNLSNRTTWTFNTESAPTYLLYSNELLYVFTQANKTYILNVFGKPYGDWPQALHDNKFSGNMQTIEQKIKPEAAIPVLPENGHEQFPGNVIFTWDISDDPNISYTLLIRYSSGFDKVYAGPEKGLDNFSLNLESGKYSWHIVSQDEDGSLKISEEKNFEIEQE